MHPLKAWLTAASLTAEAFAARMDTSAQYLSQIMCGRRRPSPEFAQRISSATGDTVSARDLVFWMPPAKSSAKRNKAA